MAKREVVIYECDLCKAKVENEKDLIPLRIPYYDEEKFYFLTYDDDYDCCEKCSNKIANLIGKNFAYFDGEKDKIVKIKPKTTE